MCQVRRHFCSDSRLTAFVDLELENSLAIDRLEVDKGLIPITAIVENGKHCPGTIKGRIASAIYSRVTSPADDVDQMLAIRITGPVTCPPSTRPLTAE